MTFPEASRQYKQNKKLHRTIRNVPKAISPPTPAKYHPKHLQYTHAQPCVQIQSRSRQKQWLPPAGRCWMSTGLSQRARGSFCPQGSRLQEDAAGSLTTHSSSWEGTNYSTAASLLFLFRALTLHCYPISFSKSPPFPSIFFPDIVSALPAPLVTETPKIWGIRMCCPFILSVSITLFFLLYRESQISPPFLKFWICKLNLGQDLPLMQHAIVLFGKAL